MSLEAARRRMDTVPAWSLDEPAKVISRRFRFRDFDAAFVAVGAVALLAAREDHHPDVRFGWGYAMFALSTHAIDGLHDNDFLMARKIDELLA